MKTELATESQDESRSQKTQRLLIAAIQSVVELSNYLTEIDDGQMYIANQAIHKLEKIIY